MNEKIIQMLIEGTFQTLYMTFMSTFFAYLIGIPVGVLVYTSKDDGIAPNKFINSLFGCVINITRSIPFIILIIAVMPLTKIIVGTRIGPTATVVPLVIAAVPFVARLIETSLLELNIGVVEATQTMGATNMQIVTRVLLPECIPSIIRGISITTITLIGYSAMAGAVGGQGLGDIAIRYGYHRKEDAIMYVTIIILIVIVQLIQVLFNLLAKKVDKNK